MATLNFSKTTRRTPLLIILKRTDLCDNTKPALDDQPSLETMKIMATHTTATPPEEESHIIDAALKRRARLLITNGAIPRQTRSLIDYALQIKDPDLVQLDVVLRQATSLLNIYRLNNVCEPQIHRWYRHNLFLSVLCVSVFYTFIC